MNAERAIKHGPGQWAPGRRAVATAPCMILCAATLAAAVCILVFAAFEGGGARAPAFTPVPPAGQGRITAGGHTAADASMYLFWHQTGIERAAFSARTRGLACPE